ncbi:phage late control D family protein [Brevibacillus parabrevis]|uniref:Late control protein n=1 Tax=Brevibacillus parabrevis TaxID=54914 RepID=A0A4Y3PLB5_BREPA|nr:contractile injection system protein, VgrG/Pvc8 family [Brevibacillus parabrevis]RNB94440.1 hypothetical protein EDM60_18810 [Brevibacillus parabrevis]GEB35312.1 hypothetical protein BPA01_48920 [Brevibacillus parabrevis]
MTAARSARLQVIYNKTDITADLQPDLVAWTYTDNLSGNADDLQLTLHDVSQKWIGSWMPDLSASLQAAIIREHWDQAGKTERLALGTFEIDSIEIGFPPSTVTIKALSVPESGALLGEKKNKAWEKTKLAVIATEKAKAAGMKLFYDTPENPEYDRIEQTEETDLAFLMRLASDAGLCLKLTDKQLVIFDEAKYERAAAIATLSRSSSELKSFSAHTTSIGCYRACQVTYYAGKGKKAITGKFEAPRAPKVGRTLMVKEQVASVAEAQRLAKKKLREANKDSTQVSITMVGNPQYVAGVTVNLSGFGNFDGKYIVTRATHSQQSGYESSLELRRCLEGY